MSQKILYLTDGVIEAVQGRNITVQSIKREGKLYWICPKDHTENLVVYDNHFHNCAGEKCKFTFKTIGINRCFSVGFDIK